MASSTPRSTPSAERGRGGEKTQQTRCWKAWNMQAFSHTLCRCGIWWDVTAQLLSSRETQISSVIKLVSLANANGGFGEEEWLCVYGQSGFQAKIKMPFVWIVGVQPHKYWFTYKKHNQTAFPVQQSQSELVCLSKLGLAHVYSLMWFMVWGCKGQAVISLEAHHHCFISW